MHTTSPERTLLSRKDAAAYMGICVQTLALWASSKRYDLPYLKVGKSVRYRLSDLDAFLASRTVRPMDAAE